MEYKCNTNLILDSKKKLEDIYDELIEKINKKDISKKEYFYIYCKMQNLSLYLELTKRLNINIGNNENNEKKLKLLITKIKGKSSKNHSKVEEKFFEISSYPQKMFNDLLQKDIKFADIVNKNIKQEVTLSTYVQLLQSPDADVRKKTHSLFYGKIKEYQFTLYNILFMYLNMLKVKLKEYDENNIVNYYCKVNGLEVNFVEYFFEFVKDNMNILHKYYDLKKRKLACRRLKTCDLLAPIEEYIKIKFDVNEAINIICKALEPLGE